jgi:hypothetical protein
MTDATMSITVPRRHGFRIAWTIFRITVMAYWKHDDGIVFVIGGWE